LNSLFFERAVLFFKKKEGGFLITLLFFVIIFFYFSEKKKESKIFFNDFANGKPTKEQKDTKTRTIATPLKSLGGVFTAT